MTREFVYTKPFLVCWKAMGLSVEDTKELEMILLSNTEQGDKIPGMDGARKLRIQLEGRGKRGGARVIYIDILTKERLYLLFAYPKNVQEDLTSEQKKQLRLLIEAIKEE
ncbi:MAG: type II toxin-antitoxin system RelE/ParE family toxin [Ruminococcus sp.]|nr:type II toxin-antitoxin system RelE/ParE family toxin [Ruminococcus sp.]